MISCTYLDSIHDVLEWICIKCINGDYSYWANTIVSITEHNKATALLDLGGALFNKLIAVML